MSKTRTFDLSVYFIADPEQCGGRDVVDIVRAAVAGGATMIQLRNKLDPITKVEKQARAILAITRPAGIKFIINDFVDVAVNTGADGVHVGQDDTAAEAARELLGRDRIVGITAFTPEHFAMIDTDIVDYTGTGPFYKTLTKPNKPVLGAEQFSALVALSPVPVVGIGGITPENAADVILAGAHGVAMMRAISAAENPEDAARQFSSVVKSARMKMAS